MVGLHKDNHSYLAKLIDIRLRLQKNNEDLLAKKLDDLINSLVKNERFQMLNTSNDYKDINIFFVDLNKFIQECATWKVFFMH